MDEFVFHLHHFGVYPSRDLELHGNRSFPPLILFASIRSRSLPGYLVTWFLTVPAREAGEGESGCRGDATNMITCKL